MTNSTYNYYPPPLFLNNFFDLSQVLGKDTGMITSNSSEKVLNDHYLDPTILTNLDKAALEVKIFG